IQNKPPCFRETWIWLLGQANHSKGKSNNRIIERGQLIRTISDIQEGLSWYIGYRKMKYSRDQVAKALRYLCEASMIDTTKTTRGMIITICNYDYYQRSENYEAYNEDVKKATRKHFGGATINKNDKNVNNEKNDKKIRNFLSDSDEYRLAKLLWDLIFRRKPDHKIPNLQVWAEHIDYMIRLDNRKPEDIERIIKWCQQDSFWYKNIESTQKLRKQYDRLDDEIRGDKNYAINQSDDTSKFDGLSKPFEEI
ncbi:MAG: hypothetical protein KKB31_06225, partial [Nanoarchaeota archaeon]|nr:hypothetical protein [Nanoarchaeota archaeon]